MTDEIESAEENKFRFKRTTAFEKRCCFVIEHPDGFWERCDEDSDFGIYFGDNKKVKMVSLCHYHTIYQESVWVGGETNE